MSTTSPVAIAALGVATQPLLVRRAAVLGAGTMGSRIAAHLANAGIPTLLLDMVPAGEGPRNRLALGALDALANTKPAALYVPSAAALISAGNFEDDLPKLAQCDWVIEVVAENLGIKTAPVSYTHLLGQVANQGWDGNAGAVRSRNWNFSHMMVGGSVTATLNAHQNHGKRRRRPG